MPDPGVPKLKGGRALRQVSAMGIAETPQEVDGSVVRLEQLADLADALVAQVGAVREHYEQLQRTLETPQPEVVPTVGAAHPVEDGFVERSDGESDGPQLHDSA